MSDVEMIDSVIDLVEGAVKKLSNAGDLWEDLANCYSQFVYALEQEGFKREEAIQIAISLSQKLNKK